MRLPFIQVRQDAFIRCEELASILNIDRELALGRMCFFWRWALESGPVTSASRPRLISALRCDDAQIDAMVCVGFLEERGDDYRIRGMSEYVGALHKKAKEAKRKKNWRLRPDADMTRTSASNPVSNTETNTDTETINKKKKSAARRAEKPPDPRFREAVAALESEYEKARGEKYAFGGGRDAKAVKSLLSKSQTQDELLARWRRGLGMTTFPRVSSIHELDAHWNHLGAGAPPAAQANLAGKPANLKAPIRAESFTNADYLRGDF